MQTYTKTVPTRIGFRARTTTDDSPEALELVRRAVARAKEGDDQALGYLYVTYSHNVYGYVRSIVQDDYEAEDVTQHVFAKLITCVQKYDDRGVPFFAWLLRLAHNVAVDHLRANRLTPTANVLDPDASCGSNLEQSQTLRLALDNLPEDQRQVVVMRHIVGLTPSEIADRLGRSEASVHGLHHRGRRAMREELERLGSTPFTRAEPRAPAIAA
jgi:RNA polymerase sigma-70 factor (ECF subfamily)